MYIIKLYYYCIRKKSWKQLLLSVGILVMNFLRKRRLKVDIVFVFTCLIIATVIGITSFVYFQNKQVILELVERGFASESQMVLNATNSYMQAVQNTVQIATKIFDMPDVKLSVDSREAQYLLNAVRVQKQLELFYYGDEGGNFLQAAILGDIIYIKQIKRVEKKAVTLFHYFDKNFKVRKKETITDSGYDPRVRPWYKGAKSTATIFWTNPYIFFENGKPGITVACPIYDKDKKLKGVIAGDITLCGLSDFLDKASLSRNSISFMTDGSGKLLACSGDIEIVSKKNGKLKRLMPYELKIPQMTLAVRYYQDNKKGTFSYKYNGKRYLAYFTRIPDTFGRNWLFATIAPEDDFIGPIKKTLHTTILLALLGLMIAVLVAILLARQISQPIEKLATEIMNIRNFEFSSDDGIKSHIYEIQQMNEAVQAMKNSLQAFQLYVPATLVRQLIDSGEPVTIGGQSRELTVFFSDIANSTTIAEDIPPKDLMLQLSDYFDVMTEVIEAECGGTIDKFIGDAVMAFWGAPISNDEHAILACRAALKCQKKVAELNEKWQAEGKYPFVTRIGINTGYMIVGNMGSKRRMNYSVIGDEVNLASRLEKVNKIYGTNIVISKGTHRYVRNEFVCRPIDQIAVKGKLQGIMIYELMAEKGTSEVQSIENMAKRFHAGYELYLKRKWREAQSIFSELLEEFPDDRVCKIYIERCSQFIQKEPDPNWSGVSKLSDA